MSAAAPEGVERDYPLARLTTVRTGGAGRLVRPARATEERLRRAARLGRARRASR